MCADPAPGVAGRQPLDCPDCATPNYLDEASRRYLVRTRQPAQLRELLVHGTRTVRCRFCGAALPVDREVVVEGDGWVERALQGAKARHSNLAELQRAVERRLRTHLRGIVTELAAAGQADEQVAIVAERWRELTFEVVTAVLLADDGVTGLSTGLEQLAPAAAPLAGLLPVAQAYTILALAADLDGQPTVEAVPMLDRYAVDGLVVREAIPLLRRHVSLLPWEQMSLRARWLTSLTLAQAAFAAGLPDPDPVRTAQSYFGFVWHLLTVEPGNDDDAALPAAARLKQLLDEEALADTALDVAEFNNEQLDRVQAVLARAGHPGLLRTITGKLPSALAASTELMREAIQSVWEKTESVPALAQGLQMMLHALDRSGRVEFMVELADHAIAVAGDSAVARATMLTQLGAALKQARRPRLFLERVGTEPAAWEMPLPDIMKLALGVERSNALRLIGDVVEAREILEQLSQLQMMPRDQLVMRLNLAILKRETGAPDAALAELQSVLAEAADDQIRFEVLQSLASTTAFVGDSSAARHYLRQAMALAAGPRAMDKPQLVAALAALDAAAGDAFTLPDDLNALVDVDRRAILSWGAAATAALEHDPGSLGEEQITRTVEALRRTAERAAHDGDRMVQLNALRVIAGLREAAGQPEAYASWAEVIEVRGEAEADPFELAVLARHLFRMGVSDAANTALSLVPYALSRELGHIKDVRAVLDATGRLRRTLAQLAADLVKRDLTAVPPGRPIDLRVVGELQRDAIGGMLAERHQPSLASASGSASASAPADEVEAVLWSRLASDGGTTRVLDWVETPTNLVGTLTTVGPGGLSSKLVEPLPRDVIDIARRTRARLNGWRRGRHGDPLDYEPWRRIEGWLRDQIPDALPSDHLVIIEHQWLAGLPWHAVDAPWTTSYAPGWRALRRIAELRPRLLNTAGVVSVPALGDSPDLRTAFDEAAERTRAWAAATGRTLRLPESTSCDKATVLDIFASVDLLKLQTHGLLVPEDHEVALMVSADGHLPPQHVITAAQSKLHRVSWRDLQELPRSPDTVVSAACSTGATVIGGLGERLGLYGALRHSGTRTVLAPAWDCIAEDVLGILDPVIAHIADGHPVARAVRDSARAAASSLPRWRSHVLAVEGDWR